MVYAPKITITPTMARNLELIAEAKGIIEKSPILPSVEKLMRREARARSVHASTHLEGNRLLPEQVAKVLAGEEVKAFKKDLLEVQNYNRVLDFIEANYANPEFRILETTVREMNRIILEGIEENELGAYRKGQVVVQNSKTKEVVFTPPPAYDVPVLVRDLVDFLGRDRTSSPVLEAGTAHYELVRIHPFTDGNGRTSRALAILVLYRRGYDVRRIFSVEDYADTHPNEYYGALRAADKEGEPSPFLEFFAEAMAVELSKVKDRLLSVSLDKELRNRIGQIFLNDRQWDCLVYIRQKGSIGISEYMKLIKERASLRTAKSDLTFMVKKKVLVREGKGPSTRYRIYA
jgi:Fic family protein